MLRDYDTGKTRNVIYFVGTEVEKTPAYGMRTLFVTGARPVEDIEKRLNSRKLRDIKHIFFGANHSFNPGVEFPQDANQWTRWEKLITHFLNKDYLCTLDVPYDHAEALLESELIEHNNFIPQIRIPLPYIKQYNYNTMIKIDDKDFKATNPGVWCHNLHDLMDREKFTDWREYSLDTIIK